MSWFGDRFGDLEDLGTDVERPLQGLAKPSVEAEINLSLYLPISLSPHLPTTTITLHRIT